MSKARDDSFQIGQSLPDGIWELTPRSGDTLNGLKVKISDKAPVTPAPAPRKGFFGSLVDKLPGRAGTVEDQDP